MRQPLHKATPQFSLQERRQAASGRRIDLRWGLPAEVSRVGNISTFRAVGAAGAHPG